jgi:YD repeat-containing protein
MSLLHRDWWQEDNSTELVTTKMYDRFNRLLATNNGTWSYQYDTLGQLTSAVKNPDAQYQFTYSYDTIGNRISDLFTFDNGQDNLTMIYESKGLKQYTSRLWWDTFLAKIAKCKEALDALR